MKAELMSIKADLEHINAYFQSRQPIAEVSSLLVKAALLLKEIALTLDLSNELDFEKDISFLDISNEIKVKLDDRILSMKNVLSEIKNYM